MGEGGGCDGCTPATAPPLFGFFFSRCYWRTNWQQSMNDERGGGWMLAWLLTLLTGKPETEVNNISIFLVLFFRRYCLVSSPPTKLVESMVGWGLGNMTVCKEKPTVPRGFFLQYANHAPYLHSVFFILKFAPYCLGISIIYKFWMSLFTDRETGSS